LSAGIRDAVLTHHSSCGGRDPDLVPDRQHGARARRPGGEPGRCRRSAAGSGSPPSLRCRDRELDGGAGVLALGAGAWDPAPRPPAVTAEAETTTFVTAAFEAAVNAQGCIVLERRKS